MSVVLCRYVNENTLQEYAALSQVDYWRVQFLDVRGLALTTLPVTMPELIHLNCRDNCLTTLPRYPRLQWLDISNNCLRTLPELPKLQTLYCTNNPELQRLPYLPGLEYLEAMFTDLRELRGYPRLTHANSAYSELQVLSNCPALIHLNASATNLDKLPNCPHLKELHLKGSPALEQWHYSDAQYREFRSRPTTVTYHQLLAVAHPIISTNWPNHCVGAYALD